MTGQMSKCLVPRHYKSSAAFFGGALLCLTYGASAAAESTNSARNALTSHRVLYDMTLGHAEQGANISNASGTMFYRFEALCEGWEIESRVFMRLGYNSDGETRLIETTWSFGSFESYDGEQFTFHVDHNQDGFSQEVFAGEAGIADGIGLAQFDDDEGLSVDLPEGTIFPTRHLMLLLNKAQSGQQLVTRTIFDGASKHNPYLVNAYILGPVVNGEIIQKVGPGIAVNRHIPALKDSSVPVQAAMSTNAMEHYVWRIRLGYFPVLSDEEFPEFEIEVDYDTNGVARRMVQDFGDFTLNLAPRSFEKLSPADCQ